MARVHNSPVPEWAVKTWWNDHYIVCQCVDREDPIFGCITRLMVQNAKGTTEVPWADLQRIKSELVGPNRVALQVFPAESEVVDRSNSYHIHVLSEEFSARFTAENSLGIRYLQFT
jgi:hypothetical protein